MNDAQVCACGCGQELKKPTSRWAPGHHTKARQVPLEQRFWGKVDRTGTCWLWLAGKNSNGYGKIAVSGKTMLAHRVSYSIATGKPAPPKDSGLTLDHLCRNRACVNPDHLELVTNRENALRGFGAPALNARKTHCIRGHEFTPENTGPNAYGGRRCKACLRADSKAREASRPPRQRDRRKKVAVLDAATEVEHE